MTEIDPNQLMEGSRRVAEGQTLIESACLADVDVVNGWALPLRDGKPAIPTGLGFGWHQDQIDYVMKTRWQDYPPLLTIEDEKAVVLSFAGGYTYGHWIIDIATRLEMTHKLLVNEPVKYLIPGPPHPWFFPFLAAHGVTPEMCVPLGVYDKVHVKRLLVPSLMRVNDFLPEWPFAASFARLRAHGEMLAAPIPNRLGKRLWIKRTVTIASRPGLDDSNLGDLMNEFGFKPVTPAFLSIGEQAALFGAAEIIIGEDSSSLHNIVWGQPKTLIVLNAAERINLIHLGMCNVIGTACHYVFGDVQADGSFAVDAGKVRSLLEGAGL